MTDAEGRYELSDLPAGRYTLFASKDGYVSSAYGQRGPRDAGRPVELVEGEQLEKVDVRLSRGGVVTGRVVDEHGEPMPDVAVAALQFQLVRGRRRLVPVRQMARTNDIGEYRLFGLPPGAYHVSATYHSPLAGSEDELSGTSISYAPMYYPGTPTISEAQPVMLLGGQEGGADFRLSPIRAVQISGTALDSGGRPLMRGLVSIRPAGGAAEADTRNGFLRTDGTFVINAVPRGTYTLAVIGVSAPVDASGLVPGAAPLPEVGTLSVTVLDEDLTGLRLTSARGGVVRGRVTVEGGSAPLSLQGVRINCIPVDSMSQGPGGLTAMLQPDLTFEIRGLFGPCIINALVPNLVIKAVRQGGRELADETIDAAPERLIGDVELLLTGQHSVLAGSVTNAEGAAPGDYTVVAFPKDKARWRFPSPRIRTGRPDQNGLFKITGLPAGDYFVAAVRDLEEGAAQEPGVLNPLVDLATTTRVTDGGTHELALRLVALPQQ